MKGAIWVVLVALALSACGDEVAFELELRLEAGQAVADLETSKIYSGPGTFQLERRGAELGDLRAFRLAVYHGNNMASHEQEIGPMDCQSYCVSTKTCDSSDVRIEQQRWGIESTPFPWQWHSGWCAMADGSKRFFVR